MTILSEITLPQKYIPLFQLQLRKLFTTVNAGKEETAKQFRTRLTELEQKIENLEERHVEGKVKEELYEKFIIKYNVERKELLEELLPSPINASNSKNLSNLLLKVSQSPLWHGISAITRKSKECRDDISEGMYHNM